MQMIQDTHPQLAAQLADPALGATLPSGSGRTVQWRCPVDTRHVWSAAVYSRVGGTGCPFCAGRRVLAGVNDLATTHPAIARLLVKQEEAITVSAGSHAKLQWTCVTDARHIFTASVRNIALLGRGCSVCANKQVQAGVNDLATTHPALAAELVDTALASSVYAGSTKTVEWRCDNGTPHTWTARLRDRMHGAGCPVCSGHRIAVGVNDLATTHPDLSSELDNPQEAKTVSRGSDRVLSWRCPKGHIWQSSVSNRVAGNQCSVCSNQSVLVGVNDLATTHPELAVCLTDPLLATTVTAGSKTVLEWRCSRNPRHTWMAACYHRSGSMPTDCPRCFGPEPSQAEDRLAEAVQRLVPDLEVLRSDRTLLGTGHELDIVVPSSRLAIEFNGLYWHSLESGRALSYHADKSAAARERGIRLVHVWEDDWRDLPDIVLRQIAHRLNATSRLLNAMPDADPRIAQTRYARTLILSEATGGQARTFLEQNHVQGATVLTRSFALRDEDGSIRALLGLRSPRNNARMKRGPGVWEIQRYATFGSVPGGFTRLLAHAERTLREDGLELSRWISFSANDVSEGGMYRVAGFTAEEVLLPDYRYAGNITGWRRAPKEAFQRKRFRNDENLLWDESWSEREAAQRNGLVRIYDAGKTRWVREVF